MPPFKNFVFRVQPGSGDKIGTDYFLDPISGDVLMQEVIGLVGAPTQLVQLCPAGTTALQDFPDDGANNTVVAASGQQITLASNALGSGTPLSPLGLGIAIVGGTGAGQFREFIDGGSTNGWVNQSSRIAKVNRNWDVTPTGSSTYRLGVPCFRCTEVVVKSEFSAAQASTPAGFDIQLAFYDYGVRAGDPQQNLITARGGYRYVDELRTVGNTDDLTDPVVGGYRHGVSQVVSARGATMFRVRLVRAPESGGVALFGGAT